MPGQAEKACVYNRLPHNRTPWDKIRTAHPGTLKIGFRNECWFDFGQGAIFPRTS